MNRAAASRAGNGPPPAGARSRVAWYSNRGTCGDRSGASFREWCTPRSRMGPAPEGGGPALPPQGLRSGGRVVEPVLSPPLFMPAARSAGLPVAQRTARMVPEPRGKALGPPQPPRGGRRTRLTCRLRARRTDESPLPPPVPGRSPGPSAPRRGAGARRPEGGLAGPGRGAEAPERPHRRRFRGSNRPDVRPLPRLPDRLPPRAEGAHRLRAPLRAPDVPGDAERPEGDLRPRHRGGAAASTTAPPGPTSRATS